MEGGSFLSKSTVNLLFLLFKQKAECFPQMPLHYGGWFWHMPLELWLATYIQPNAVQLQQHKDSNTGQCRLPWALMPHGLGIPSHQPLEDRLEVEPAFPLSWLS